MSNYNKATNFAVKDTLNSGDPDKIVSGAEIDNEFNAISSAVNSKLDSSEFESGLSELSTFPSGGIVMWSGAIGNIPLGWTICDGTDGTPDLRDRFIVGAGSTYLPDDTGGENSVQLTESEMPSHSHNINSAGGHIHSGETSLNRTALTGRVSFSEYTGSLAFAGGIFERDTSITGTQPAFGSGSTVRSFTIDANHDHNLIINSSGTHTHSMSSVGGSNAHENRPPNYALAFIMKL